jgi:hypothetical protein
MKWSEPELRGPEFHGLGLRWGVWFLAVVAVLWFAPCAQAQGNAAERSFPQSPPIVEKALQEMQSATSGRLPALEGFATAADHPLDRYQRGYYQAKFQVAPGPAGGSVVHVKVQVTAWYADQLPARSGYQVLPSNGRLEADLLDQLAEQLTVRASKGAQSGIPQPAAKSPPPAEPTLSAPVPRLPDSSGGLSSSLAQSLAQPEKPGKNAPNKAISDDQTDLQAEAASLEEILKNQAHPKNLVAVKKSGTPVVASASLTAKTLFLASAHDEFEMLDFNRDWVHVRVSGLSRGWIWRNNLEMPESVPDSDLPASAGVEPAAADLFHVSREEKAPFPGDWAPLRGKTVKIVSVEKTNESEKDSGPKLRLEFVKSVLDKDYAEVAKNPQDLAGIVVIFDSADGGMIAATLPTLQQWKAGTLSDAALWHQCFFDPPEIFGEPGPAASQ